MSHGDGEGGGGRPQADLHRQPWTQKAAATPEGDVVAPVSGEVVGTGTQAVGAGDEERVGAGTQDAGRGSHHLGEDITLQDLPQVGQNQLTHSEQSPIQETQLLGLGLAGCSPTMAVAPTEVQLGEDTQATPEPSRMGPEQLSPLLGALGSNVTESLESYSAMADYGELRVGGDMVLTSEGSPGDRHGDEGSHAVEYVAAAGNLSPRGTALKDGPGVVEMG